MKQAVAPNQGNRSHKNTEFLDNPERQKTGPTGLMGRPEKRGRSVADRDETETAFTTSLIL